MRSLHMMYIYICTINANVCLYKSQLGNDLYFVMATEDTAHIAEVEVVNGNLLAGTEVFLTRLHRGQYFGQKFFLTRRAVS